MNPAERRAVVLGGGLAGMLAAQVLARHFGTVTVVDRDDLGAPGPQPRTGLPQARHLHQLWSSGARVLDTLLPGLTQQLLRAGAKRVSIPTGNALFSAYGWQHRFPEAQFMLSASRDLLDWTVRQRVRADPRIVVRDRTQADGLLGSAETVTGVAVRSVADGETTELAADLVVDATGRSSATRRWLAELGLRPVEEDLVDTGITYATRLFRVPEWVDGSFPGVSVQPDHRDGRPGQSGYLLPIEGDRWIVALSGTRGGEPSADDASFTEFAGNLRHPIIAELIGGAEPLTSVQRSRSTANRRLYPERAADWPDGLLLLGDSMASFNPSYGHGMVTAARSAAVLDRELSTGDAGPATMRRVMRGLADVVDEAWTFATTQDICYPNCRVRSGDDRLLPQQANARREMTDAIGTAAARQPEIASALFDVVTLAAPVSSLMEPRVLAALRSGPTHPPLKAPPFTPEELAMLRRSTRRTVRESTPAAG
ncbi:FAD-dependent monooxygenase [Micromonospora sp. NPDC049171]|uniref:FAD-dependent oxidoreductase n=1 Tax=Micromonospora sp. NPDC049171 TaxID=3155770 RepID=UPI0033C8B330